MMFLLFVCLGCLSLSSCMIENVGFWCVVLLFALGCSCVCVTCVFVLCMCGVCICVVVCEGGGCVEDELLALGS